MQIDEFWSILHAMPRPQPVFFRLYHQYGVPLFYSMEDVPGTYIELDQETFAQGKSRVRVINGVLTELTYQTTEKLVPSDSGTMCHGTDVTIVVTQNGTYWSKKIYEQS